MRRSAVELGVQQLHNFVICSGELFLVFGTRSLAFAPQSRDSFASRRLDPDPTRYEPAALRWLQRLIDERLPPLTEVALAASALAELRHGHRNAGIETLKACSDHDPLGRGPRPAQAQPRHGSARRRLAL